jgi:uncharacterized protein YjlB
MMTEPQILKFGPDDGIPNSSLPLVFWRGRLPSAQRSGTAACALFKRSGWQGTWVYTVYPFWHFHTRGHEVLACVSGTARIALGGDRGFKADVAAGDVCIIPAGVGHRRLDASADFQMAGGYPPGQEGDIVQPGDIRIEEAMRTIEQLPLPVTDPITGLADGIAEIWRDASRRVANSAGNQKPAAMDGAAAE